MVGKLTWYRATSSIVCNLLDRGGFVGFDKHSCLQQAIDEKNGVRKDTFEQKLHHKLGDWFEEPIIMFANKQLGGLTNLEPQVDYKIEHPTLPLEASLDGRCRVVNHHVKHNPEEGIYIVGHDELVLNGDIPIEVKLTRNYASGEEPPKYLGVDQLHSSMEILGSNYGILIVQYASTDLRIYIYKKDKDFADTLATAVLDFDRRVTEEDYYKPETPSHVATIFDNPDHENEKILPEDAVSLIDTIQALKDTQSIAKKHEAGLMVDLMMIMGNHSKARAANYILNWKTLPACEEHIKENKIKAKPERRSGIVTIREGNNG